jgi:hypothetical protein
MVRLAFISLILGFLIGPGYVIYCKYFSGKQVGTYTVAAKGSTWVLPYGITISEGHNATFKPFAVTLDPGMEPLTFVLHAHAVPSPGIVRLRNQYEATLYLEGQAVQRVPVYIGAESKSGTSFVSIDTTIDFSPLSRGGEYYFVLSEKKKPELDMSGVEVEIRRNSLRPVWPISLFGMALLILGVVVLIMQKRRATAAGSPDQRPMR